MQTKTKLISCLIILAVVTVVLLINFDISSIISRELGINANSHRAKLAKKAKIKLVFWHAMGGPLGKVVVNLVDKFNETHPDIFVKEQFMGNYDILIQKLISSIISNSQPDISQVYESWTTMIKKGNAIVPLDKYIEKEKNFNKDDIYKVLLDNNMYDGKLMSLPFNKSIPVLYYNKNMFKEAGLDPERPPKNWDEFLAFAKKLTVDSNKDGLINQHGTAITPNALILECMIFQYGGKLLSKDNMSSLINEGGSADALQYLADLINKYKVAYRTSGYNNQSDFVARKIAMITGSIVSKFFMRDDITFKLGIAPMPSGKFNKTVLSGTNIAIINSNDDVKHDAAWVFLKWLTDTEQTAYWSTETPYIPVRKSALKTKSWQKLLAEEPQILEVIKQVEVATYEPRIGTWYSCRMILVATVEKALMGYSPQKVLDEAVEKMNQKLNPAYR